MGHATSTRSESAQPNETRVLRFEQKFYVPSFPEGKPASANRSSPRTGPLRRTPGGPGRLTSQEGGSRYGGRRCCTRSNHRSESTKLFLPGPVRPPRYRSCRSFNGGLVGSLSTGYSSTPGSRSPPSGRSPMSDGPERPKGTRLEGL